MIMKKVELGEDRDDTGAAHANLEIISVCL
jgi:hypothetical protein